MSFCEDGQVFERRNSLQVDAVKCAKITNMFAATSSTATAGPSTSAVVPGAKAAAGVAPRY